MGNAMSPRGDGTVLYINCDVGYTYMDLSM